MDKIDLLPHGERYIIGLTDIATEGEFVWDDTGEEIDKELKGVLFDPREPNNNGGIEHCIRIIPGSDHPTGNDIPCDISAHKFVCERPMFTRI